MRRSSRRGGVGLRRPGALLLALEPRIVLDSTYFPLSSGSLRQDWEVRSLLVAANSWSNVPGIEGFRGDGLTGSPGANPQVIVAGDDPGVVNVETNQTNPSVYTTGGVAEFEIPTPIGTPTNNTGANTVALQGSATADAPYLKIYVSNAGRTEPVRIRYDLIDIDGSTDNAVQSFALQYRLGPSGNFTNIPAGYVADASVGPSLTGTVNSIDVTLPANTIGAAEVEIRIITTNADGNDELIAIDNIQVFGNDPPVGQFVVEQDSYSVNEDAGTLTVNVLRTGSTSGSASVQFQTLSGSAVSGSDFEGTLGTLFFANGQASQPITITLLDDELPEASEFFSISLFNASGAGAIGTPSSTTVTILDNDTPPAPAVVLNEIVVNPPDADGPHEYIEIKGPAGLLLTNLYFVSIEGEGGGAGLADLVVDLSTYAIGSNGLLIIKGNSGPATHPDTAVVIDTRFDNAVGILENGSNSFALIFAPTGMVEGSDLDIDNNGTLDLPVGTSLVDGVGSRSSDLHRAYGAELTTTVANTVLHAMSRVVGNSDPNSASAWFGGLMFDPVVAAGQDNSDFVGYDPLNATANLPGGAVITPGADNYLDGATLPGVLYVLPVTSSVDESSGTASITVVRVGGTFGTLQATYATTQTGTARPGLDFVAASGVVEFLDGVFVNSFPLTIIDDTRTEGDESIVIQFGGVEGTSVGTVVITANDLVPPTVLLNEVLNDPPGTDQPREYVELRGAPSALLAGVYLITVEGDTGSPSGGVGVIDARLAFSGTQRLGPNGLLLVTSATNPRTPQAPATAVVNWTQLNAGSAGFENGTITFMLVFSPDTPLTSGIDLDVNDDGTLELPSGAVVLDSVGWSDTGVGDRVYSSATIDQGIGTPDAATRFPTNLTPLSQAAWYGGDILNTAGNESLTYNATSATPNLPSGAVLTPGGRNFPTPPDFTQPTLVSTEIQLESAPQSITVRFSEDVGESIVSGSAFTLVNLSNSSSVLLEVVANLQGDTATITFLDTGNNLGSSLLADGNYRLTVVASAVSDPAGNVLAADQTFDFFFKNADFNRSGVVEFADLLIVAQNFGTTSGATFADGDADFDGDVDFADLLALAQRYGTGLLVERKPAATRSRKTSFAETVIT